MCLFRWKIVPRIDHEQAKQSNKRIRINRGTGTTKRTTYLTGIAESDDAEE